jgi:hypothetical protein
MRRFAAAGTAVIGVWLMTAPAVLAAQIPDSAKAPPRASQGAVPAYTDNADAEQTRQRLHELLRQVPPAVYEVLKADPSLIDRPDYLTPYPALAGFFQQHPEISRNPSFFLGEFRYVTQRSGDRSFELIQMMLAALGVAMAVTTFVGVLVWLVRTALDHRRWLRVTRVQTEVHTKLLDRLGTNEELLAYIQSPAGRRFLESAPVAVDQEAPPPAPSVPVTRILWSVQAGFVLMALGGGFWLVQTRATELAEGFWVMGVLIGALGIGFVLSAVVAFAISARLGLVNTRRAEQQV